MRRHKEYIFSRQTQCDLPVTLTWSHCLPSPGFFQLIQTLSINPTRHLHNTPIVTLTTPLKLYPSNYAPSTLNNLSLISSPSANLLIWLAHTGQHQMNERGDLREGNSTVHNLNITSPLTTHTNSCDYYPGGGFLGVIWSVHLFSKVIH